MLIVLAVGLLAGLALLLLTTGSEHRLTDLLRAADPQSQEGQEAFGTPDAGEDRRAINRRRWSRLMKAPPPGPSAVDQLAFDLDLVGICLKAGLPTSRALELTADASQDRSRLARLGRSLEFGHAREASQDDECELVEVAALIDFSRQTGVALAPLLTGMASDLRRSEHRRRQLAAARLGVHLVIPLGVCILPAFILLGVVPVLLTLLSDMSGIFP